MKVRLLLLAGICFAGLALVTMLSFHPVARSLRTVASDAQTAEVTDRNGLPLSASYGNRWNSYDNVPLYNVPDLLKSAFVVAEDRRYFTHGGVDWPARAAALWENIKNLRRVRGASTISEQVVHLLDPRPRNLWSKWVEGFEAIQLEHRANKADILEFYLNQVPYAANRRGVAQGAQYYFGRDLSTLSDREMLALAVLARSPTRYDSRRHPEAIDAAIERLVADLSLPPARRDMVRAEHLAFQPPATDVDIAAFIRYVRLTGPAGPGAIHTTLDATLQQQVQAILDQRLRALGPRHVHDGAVLIADHQTGEILAWVVSSGTAIDVVRTPRQPGSALKPFLYTLALDKGWTPATIIEDAPMAEAVGAGLHRFRDYSNLYYGPVTLREALGNSLNIPAVRTIAYVGPGTYLTTLRRLGFASLDQDAAFYDEGLALGDGAVSLFEMVQGYAALAHHGVMRPLQSVLPHGPAPSMQVYSDEATSLMSNILSDPYARLLEFGSDSVLNLPVQTAAKTGTSSGYRDAWTLGFNDRYVVGLWMGNLDGAAMDGVTGSTGPALAFRSIMALLNQNRDTAPLYQSPKLVTAEVCTRPVSADQSCRPRSELFRPGTMPVPMPTSAERSNLSLAQPTDGLEMAYDPRVPASAQNFRFELAGWQSDEQVDWILDGRTVALTSAPQYLWPIMRGPHVLKVHIQRPGEPDMELSPVSFIVK